MVMVCRALGGSIARKLRAVLPDLGLKGEKAVVTEVRKRVSILGGWGGFVLRRRCGSLPVNVGITVCMYFGLGD